MKRVFSALIAGAMVAAMAVPAFAASFAASDTVYNGDGEKNGDVYDDTFSWALSDGAIKVNSDINIDGVVPNATLYIPLAKSNDAKATKDATFTAGDVATKLGITGTAASALEVGDFVLSKAGTATIEITDVESLPDSTTAYITDTDKYYVVDAADKTAADKKASDVADELKVGYSVSLKYLVDKDYFKLDLDKDDGSKYVSKVEIVSDKKLGSLERTAYLKITLAESTTTSDLKSSGTITLEAKKSSDDAKATGDKWTADTEFTYDYTFWINNVKKTNDDNAETGDRIYFDPDDNEDNTLVWGDDRAALFFESNDDANAFYARLQTKSDSEIYSTYGDPVNADLWFFDFVGNPTIPATSRATLTLGIPWDEDDDYTPNPEDCFIYEKDADGNLVDVTSNFTYSEDNDGTTEIPGWTIKTRTLGTYIISDTELDTTVVDDVDEEPADDTASTVDGGKEIPNTGSSDMVGVAVVAAVVSLAAAGAVAFKKASK